MSDVIMNDQVQTQEYSATLGSLAKALAKAQGEISTAKKDSTNPHFKSAYADLASIWDACRGPLSAADLCVIQTTQAGGRDGVTLVTTLLHSSGEWIRGTLYMPNAKGDAQGMGSALTYARRYALAAIVGVAPDDDDGERAVEHKPRKFDLPRPLDIEPKRELPKWDKKLVEETIEIIKGAKTQHELDEYWKSVTQYQLHQNEEIVSAWTSQRKKLRVTIAENREATA